ncbi:hypothetical protein [Fodinicola feengrottensis]|uniref:hypothetical protein n=1 Tax=Fodinicola feengrottensis TaxID=435914 RepID=UPI0013D7F30D|nr:hypothetical protein [Fodinicola feengrottensis]
MTGHYGQGAFNTDDIARACVVYLRDWQQNHTAASGRKAYQLLRGLTYLQTISGPNAGNPLLWMQSDGALTPSATPPDSPDPSDSGPSYWLARSIWALGEGYAAFRSSDRKFATFLRNRLDLAVSALRRQVLVKYGDWEVSDGRRVPGWLINGAADASSRLCSDSPRTSTLAAGQPRVRHWPSSPKASPLCQPGTRKPGRTERSCRPPTVGPVGMPGPRRCRPRWLSRPPHSAGQPSRQRHC